MSGKQRQSGIFHLLEQKHFGRTRNDLNFLGMLKRGADSGYENTSPFPLIGGFCTRRHPTEPRSPTYCTVLDSFSGLQIYLLRCDGIQWQPSSRFGSCLFLDLLPIDAISHLDKAILQVRLFNGTLFSLVLDKASYRNGKDCITYCSSRDRVVDFGRG